MERATRYVTMTARQAATIVAALEREVTTLKEGAQVVLSQSKDGVVRWHIVGPGRVHMYDHQADPITPEGE